MFVDFFIRRPVFASVCSIIIVLVGAVSIPLLPVDYYPQVAPPAVRVTAVYPGADAETVETAVTNVLEQEINGVEGIRYISSVSSSNGTSQITVTFSPDRDLDTAAVDVQNRVARVQARLPAEVIQNGLSVEKAGDSAFVQVVALRSEAGEYDELFVSNYAELFVRDALRRIRGVSDVIVFGERTYAMRIWLDPTRLAGYGLTALDVVNAVRQQNIQVPAGQIGSQPSPPGSGGSDQRPGHGAAVAAGGVCPNCAQSQPRRQLGAHCRRGSGGAGGPKLRYVLPHRRPGGGGDRHHQAAGCQRLGGVAAGAADVGGALP